MLNTGMQTEAKEVKNWLEEASRGKLEGNQLIGEERYAEASLAYTHVINTLLNEARGSLGNLDIDISPECQNYANSFSNVTGCSSDEARILDVLIPKNENLNVGDLVSQLYANRALCHMKLGHLEDAVRDCDVAVQRHPKYIKALFRRANVKKMLHQYESSMQDLWKLIYLDEGNKEIQKVFDEVRRVIALDADARGARELPLSVLSGDTADVSPKKLTDALVQLRKWVTKWRKPEVILREGMVEKVVKLASAAIESKTKELLGVQLAAWQMILVLVAERPSEDEIVFGSTSIDSKTISTGKNNSKDSSVNYQKKVHSLNEAISSDPVITKCREEVIRFFPMEQMFKFSKLIFRQNFGKIPDDVSVFSSDTAYVNSTALLNTATAIVILHTIQYLGSLDSPESLEIVLLGLACVESETVQKNALTVLGYKSDLRRRLGSRCKALTNSQALMKCLEAAVALSAVEDLSASTEGTTSLASHVEYTVVTCLSLLADADRNASDLVDMTVVAGCILDPYLQTATDDHTKFLVGLNALTYLWHADRNATQLYMSQSGVLVRLIQAAATKSTVESSLQQTAATVLLLAMESKELRKEILDFGGIDVLLDLGHQLRHNGILKAKIVATLAKLAMHNETTRSEVFEKADMFNLSFDFLSGIDTGEYRHSKRLENELYQSVLEIIFFLSMHGAFKCKLVGIKCNTGDKSNGKRIVDLDEAETQQTQTKQGDITDKGFAVLQHLAEIARIALEKNEAASMFSFAGVIHNMLRSREDKDRIKRTPDMPMLESDELQQLKEMYSKLPEHARPESNAEFDRGDKQVAEALRDKLLDLEICRTLSQFICRKPTPTINLLILAAECIRFFAQAPSRRGKVVQQGGLKALLVVASALPETEDSKRDIRQAIAHIAISMNPKIFAYREAGDMAPHLIVLLSDSYELYQYEAALGLTNLLSEGGEVCSAIWNLKGYIAFRELATSDNPLLRAAGLECICNVSVAPDMTEKIVSGQFTFDLKLLLAFLFEDDNSRARCAAAGSLATLCRDPRVSWFLCGMENFKNIINRISIGFEDDTPLEKRVVHCAVCLLESLELSDSDMGLSSDDEGGKGGGENNHESCVWYMSKETRQSAKIKLIHVLKQSFDKLSSASQKSVQQYLK